MDLGKKRLIMQHKDWNGAGFMRKSLSERTGKATKRGIDNPYGQHEARHLYLDKARPASLDQRQEEDSEGARGTGGGIDSGLRRTREGISTSQEILIRSTVKALGVPFLIELFINKYGPIIIKGRAIELHPILSKNYLAFFNTIRQNLLALKELGKDRTDDVLAPYQIIEKEKK